MVWGGRSQGVNRLPQLQDVPRLRLNQTFASEVHDNYTHILQKVPHEARKCFQKACGVPHGTKRLSNSTSIETEEMLMKKYFSMTVQQFVPQSV